MSRSVAAISALAILGSFFALTLFHAVSLTAVWKTGSVNPLNGRSVSITGRGGALEFSQADIVFLFTPKGGLTATSEPQPTRLPYWIPRFYKRDVSISTRWNLVYAEGLRIPLWPLLGINFFMLLRSRKRSRPQ